MSYGIPAAEPSAQVPVCPRHPDRPSYVRCQRCGRPACPDCQRAAAVGFQCVDCVNETKRTTPAVKTVYGGAVATGKPLVTYGIIALCAVMYVLQWMVPGEWIYQNLAFANVFATPEFGEFEPWRMLTSAFLHSQGFILHIVLNMYMLWIFGQALEPLLGRVRFLAVVSHLCHRRLCRLPPADPRLRARRAAHRRRGRLGGHLRTLRRDARWCSATAAGTPGNSGS